MMRWARNTNLVALLALAALAASAQVPDVISSSPGAVILVSSSAAQREYLRSPSLPEGEILREIDDPHSGQRWLLLRDASHPGGPGLLLLAGGRSEGTDPAQRALSAAAAASTPPEPPLIHSGESVVIEQHTAIVEAHLQATALRSAILGDAFNARLAIGGQVVHVVAVGPGRAIFEEQRQQKVSLP